MENTIKIVNKKYFIKLIIIALLASCTAPSKIEVDLLIKNAVIYQVNDEFTTASAMAVKDGKIVSIGHAKDIINTYNSKEIYDAEGKTIIPGIIDAHAHLYNYGLKKLNVDLTGSESVKEVLQRLLDFHKEHPTNFIIGYGWDERKWKNQEFPNKEILDSFFPNIPVVLSRIEGHVLWLNSKALEIVNVNTLTKIPESKIILSDNQPTGILIDFPIQLAYDALPNPDRRTQINALLKAEQEALSYGLTTVADAGLDRKVVELIDSLHRINDMKLKIYAMLNNTPQNLKYFLEVGVFETQRLNVRSFKVFVDETVDSKTESMKNIHPYMLNHYDFVATTLDSLENLANILSETDFQLNAYVIGDTTKYNVLKIYDSILKDLKDKRWRIENAQSIFTKDFNYFSDNIVPIVQPIQSIKTLLSKSSKIALGTDFPKDEINPMHTFFVAVARKDSTQKSIDKIFEEEILSREKALRGMTIWAAYANFEDKKKGSLEVGKWADFVILDRDLMKVENEELPLIKVLKTYINGEKVFERK